MRALKATVVYFAVVFAAGFLFGLVRVPFLVPHLGVRLAELLEMPPMFLLIVFAARFVVRRFGPLPRASRFLVGLCALVLLVAAELLLAAILQGQSPSQYVASRDPVSGSVYVVMLLLFAIMPVLQRSGQGPDDSSRRPLQSAAKFVR